MIYEYRYPIMLVALLFASAYTLGYDSFLGDYTNLIALVLEAVGIIICVLSWRTDHGVVDTNAVEPSSQPHSPRLQRGNIPPQRVTFSQIEESKPKDVFEKFEEVKK